MPISHNHIFVRTCLLMLSKVNTVILSGTYLNLHIVCIGLSFTIMNASGVFLGPHCIGEPVL